MQDRVPGLERLLLALFVASGFAGLIYQAIWSHYLGLSLGHAAYAQTLVLGIFMGGMALGAWVVSRRARAAMTGEPLPGKISELSLLEATNELRQLWGADIAQRDERRWLIAASKVAEATLSEFSPSDAEGLWINPVWYHASEAPPSVRRVLRAYDATARRDYEAMQQSGLAALEVLDPVIAPLLVREHMLVIARLGAIGQGDLEGSVAIEREFGRNVPGGRRRRLQFRAGFPARLGRPGQRRISGHAAYSMPSFFSL